MTTDIEILEPEQQLAVAVKQADLGAESALMLENSFSDFFKEAARWREQANLIHITDASQVREMKLARETRLALKSIRVNAEKTRKRLKEDSLRTGKAIDGVANVLKFLIEPVEKHLEDQEKYVERIEAERKRKLGEERTAALAPFGARAEVYNLADMNDEEFRALYASEKAADEARVAEAIRVEEERRAAEEAEKAERERIRIENERLRAEAVFREAELKAEREKVEKERMAEAAAAEAKLSALREAAEKERKEAAAEAAAKLKREREEVERLQQIELKRKQAEAAAHEAELKAAREKEELRSAALKAPDTEKLGVLAGVIRNIEMPAVDTAEAADLVFLIKAKLSSFATWIEQSSKEL